MLWGGDDSVRHLHAFPMNPLGSEIVFGNRLSLAVLNAKKIECIDTDQLEGLAGRFCNDSYWFDQMACSSLRVVVWVGTRSSCDSAQALFWWRIAS